MKKETQRRRIGSTAHRPTSAIREQVTELGRIGMPWPAIAKSVKLAYNTLVKYYREDLEQAKHEANAKVANALFRSALEGDHTAQIFWLKCQAGWREAAVIQDRRVEQTSDLSRLSITELKQLREMLLKTSPPESTAPPLTQSETKLPVQ